MATHDIALVEAPHPLAYIRWLMALDAAVGYEDTAVDLAELVIDVEYRRLTPAGLRAKYIHRVQRNGAELDENSAGPRRGATFRHRGRNYRQ